MSNDKNELVHLGSNLSRNYFIQTANNQHLWIPSMQNWTATKITLPQVKVINYWQHLIPNNQDNMSIDWMPSKNQEKYCTRILLQNGIYGSFSQWKYKITRFKIKVSQKEMPVESTYSTTVLYSTRFSITKSIQRTTQFWTVTPASLNPVG